MGSSNLARCALLPLMFFSIQMNDKTIKKKKIIVAHGTTHRIVFLKCRMKIYPVYISKGRSPSYPGNLATLSSPEARRQPPIINKKVRLYFIRLEKHNLAICIGTFCNRFMELLHGPKDSNRECCCHGLYNHEVITTR